MPGGVHGLTYDLAAVLIAAHAVMTQ